MLRISPRATRSILAVCGALCTGLAILGFILPIVPATPFLLLAAWCFARSSQRFHRWLLGNRWFGQYIRDYQSGRGIPRIVKVGTILLLWVSVITSSLIVAEATWMRALLVVVAAGVTWHVARLPTLR